MSMMYDEYWDWGVGREGVAILREQVWRINGKWRGRSILMAWMNAGPEEIDQVGVQYHCMA